MDNPLLEGVVVDPENPYDRAARDKAGVWYMWDRALYNGKYYSYFGIAPILTVYYPCQLLTGKLPGDGTVMQVNHYYPYGGLMTDPRHTISSPAASDSRYRFSSKELSEESGEYDFGARFLDPVPGRFITLDPLAEKYYNLSPYAYCAGNPISFVDPDGRKVFFAPGSSNEFKQRFKETVHYNLESL